MIDMKEVESAINAFCPPESKLESKATTRLILTQNEHF